jgi:sugar O-acyltransferase (sialic acid O-acetyltransferase NeuD family)
MIGYSGHSFVALDILKLSGYDIIGYCDIVEKEFNPYAIPYLGTERNGETIKKISSEAYFISVGENSIRGKIYNSLVPQLGQPVNAVHPSAILAASIVLGDGVMIAAGAVLNPLVRIGKGVICNTSCTIDHECRVGDFSHIAPGAILCGNVTVGQGSFIGAGAVIRQGISIGENVMIGAGCVVVRNVPDNVVMVGNPQKELIKK